MAQQLAFMSVADLARRLESRTISPVDVVRTFLERIKAYDQLIRSFITVCSESAIKEAEQADDEMRAGGYRGVLHGIPVAHKDNCWTAGVRTTAHSELLREFIPGQDATFVRRLKSAGAILLGKTNTTEFACGNTAHFGVPRNPWDLTRFSGASSSGSASAVAAGLVSAATGSDTGGSIRIPSSFCGVVGLKPTYGRVSRRGLIPLSWSMDHVGPVTRTVEDNALLLRVMAGHDPNDPTSAREPVGDFAADLTAGVPGVRIGVPTTHFFDGVNDDVAASVSRAITLLEKLGAVLVPVKLTLTGQLADVAAVIVASEAFALHAQQLRTNIMLYGPRARRRICSGAFFTSAEYLQACQIRALWIEELEGVMGDVDVIVTPTLQYTAFTPDVQQGGPPDTSWATRPFNMSGHPALTVPCGFDTCGLPIGLQIVGRYFAEGTVYRVAHAYEREADWAAARPTAFLESPSRERTR